MKQLTEQEAMETINKMNCTEKEKTVLRKRWYLDNNTRFVVYGVWKRQNNK